MQHTYVVNIGLDMTINTGKVIVIVRIEYKLNKRVQNI